MLSIQHKVANMVRLDNSPEKIKKVGGVDCAYVGDLVVSVCIILDVASWKVLDTSVVVDVCDFPYIPSFLSFREGPASIRAIMHLKERADLLLVNGVGIAHPKGAGFASHIGVALDIPTIGITKKPLCGEIIETEGTERPILYEEKVVGYAMRNIIVTPGHNVKTNDVPRLVLGLMKEHKLPEPLYLSHKLASELKDIIRILYSKD
jgi:deoxyribonuclease V